MTLAAKNNSLEAALAAEQENLAAKSDELLAVQESIEDLKMDAYDEGVKATETFFHGDWERARVGLYEEAWTAALKAAGIAEDHDLYKNIPIPAAQPEPEPESSTAHPEPAVVPTEAESTTAQPAPVAGPKEADPPAPPSAEDDVITVD